MGTGYSYDENGIFKPLLDGRVLRIARRSYNTIITLSASREDHCWRDGW